MNILKREEFKDLWEKVENRDQQDLNRPLSDYAIRGEEPKNIFHSSSLARSSQVVSQPSGTLVVGPGIYTKGEFSDCIKAEVYGSLEGNLFSDTLVIHAGGRVKGTVKCENALISGKMEGEISVLTAISVDKTGHVEGKISYQKIAVSEGGTIEGAVHKLEQENHGVPDEADEEQAEVLLVPQDCLPSH
jgi:cytoskeletal protein CcmA (bactofilin family)